MPFSSPEPVVLGHLVRYTIKASGSEDENGWLHTCDACVITTLKTRIAGSSSGKDAREMSGMGG